MEESGQNSGGTARCTAARNEDTAEERTIRTVPCGMSAK